METHVEVVCGRVRVSIHAAAWLRDLDADYFTAFAVGVIGEAESADVAPERLHVSAERSVAKKGTEALRREQEVFRM